MPNAIEELLRFEAPSPVQARYVTQDVEHHGQVVPAGSAQLRDRLAAVARGEAFLLQGGDCAETFAGATAEAIRASSRRSCRWPSC